MTYENYRAISWVALILAGIFLLATAAAFFLLRIRDVIGFLTGSNKKKGIERIREGSTPGEKAKKQNSQTRNARVRQAPADTGQTSKISPQDRFDNMAATASMTETPHTPSTPTPLTMPMPVSEPVQAIPVPMTVTPGFVLEADITYVHSDTVIR